MTASRPDQDLNSEKWLLGLSALLLVLAGARILLLVTALPMHGYANQYDMVRTSGCIGLWPEDRPGEEKIYASREAPKRLYVLGEKHEYCVWSSEAVFDAFLVGAARAWSAFDSGAEGVNTVDLRFIGLAKAVLLCLLAGYFAWLLRHRPAISLAHAALFFAILSDPSVTLFMNTLYTEFLSVATAYAVIGASIVVWSERKLSAWLLGMLVAGLVVLGFSREQYLYLPALLLAATIIPLYRWRRRVAFLAVLSVMAIPLTYAALTTKTDARYQANRVDTYIGAVLAVSQDKLATAQRLGLGEDCVALAGANWYLRRGEDLHHSCPEVFELSSLAFLSLALAEPQTLALALLKAMPMLQQGLLWDLGMVENRDYASLADSPLPRALIFSYPALVMQLGFVPFALIMLFCGFYLVFAAAYIPLVSYRTGVAPPGATSLALLAAVVFYAFITSVFGDGFADVQRHFHLGMTALAAFVLLLLGTMASEALRLIRRRGGERDAVIPVGIAALAAVLLLGPPFLSWAKRQSLGVGMIAEPAGLMDLRRDRQISGWAIDPFGAASVRIEFSSGHTYDVPVGTEATPALFRRFYPGYPGVEKAGFRLNLPGDELSSHPAVVRAVVVNTLGVNTEIDRRRIVWSAKPNGGIH